MLWTATAFACLLVASCVRADELLGQGRIRQDTRQEGSSTPAHYMRSDSLGITRCSMPGVLDDEAVTLHIWLRVVPPSVVAPTLCAQRWPPVANCTQTAVARGFVLLQSARNSIPYYNRAGIQLLQARTLLLFSQQVYLRSYVTGVEYPLTVTMPFSPASIRSTLDGKRFNATDVNASSPKVVGQGWTTHTLDLGGMLALEPQDVEQQDFELRAVGFAWSCPFLVQRPVLGYESTRSATGAGPGAMDGPGMPRPHPAPSEWRHHMITSLTNNTQVWQVLSPFHGMNVTHYATMLWHRVLWHTPLGVNHYLLYVYESLSALLREPLIQDLVSRGVLHIVTYIEMPKHEEQLLAPTLTDIYVMQVLAYNHALLALWGTDSLVLVADVDEYIITSKPMTVVEAFTECRNTTAIAPPPRAPNETVKDWMLRQKLKAWMLKKKPLAGLQLRRTDAVCAPSADPQLCSPLEPGLAAWVGTSPADVAQGRVGHPLAWHGMTDGSDLWDRHNTKMLVDPNLARDINVHFFQRGNGTVKEEANTECVRLLHLVDLYRVRQVHDPSEAVATAAGIGSEWWWPAKVLTGRQAEDTTTR